MTEDASRNQVDLPDLSASLAEGDGCVAQDEGWLSRATPYIELFSKVATVLVLFLALLQYYEAGRDKQRERSLELVREWSEGHLADRLTRISQHLYAAAQKAQLSVKDLPEGLRPKAWQNAQVNTFNSLAAPATPETRAIRSDIDSIFQFFARAEICVSSGLCDAEIARAYFGVEAHSMLQELDPLIRQVRSTGLPSYAVATERFVAGIGG